MPLSVILSRFFYLPDCPNRIEDTTDKFKIGSIHMGDRIFSTMFSLGDGMEVLEHWDVMVSFLKIEIVVK